eukprot:5531747-Pyramimonas_sp.AAC.1
MDAQRIRQTTWGHAHSVPRGRDVPDAISDVSAAPWTPLEKGRWPFWASKAALPRLASRLQAIRGVIGD